ncbi:MAG: DNA-formamidopyrimidine glycosylase [Gammaproteobacteria bacterium]|nr:MAG: DNA-formamidopyrimidine glycosylase [Gammaproteobacteria bacterium]
MPELPEVETTRRGILPHLQYKTVQKVIVRQPKLRWPISDQLPEALTQQPIISVDRRGKYLLIHFPNGTLIIHLGMSGSLRICRYDQSAEKHDHFEIVLDNGTSLRLRDPRRFGAVLWTEEPVEKHSLLINLGPEPFDPLFNGLFLFERAKGRKLPIKTLIMDGKIVTGVGNIYASEALFLAGIHPKRAAGKISLERLQRLAEAIVEILQRAIEQGGTTLRDFVNETGKPGYFQQQLAVYGRAGQPCQKCTAAIKKIILGQRSTFYCPNCQH